MQRTMPKVIERFTASQVMKLTGITYPVLDYWVRTKFIIPAQQTGAGKGSDRFFSFPDLVAIRAALRLRKMGVSVQTLKRVVQLIQKKKGFDSGSAALAAAYLFSEGGEVYEKTSEEVIAHLRR